MSNTEKAFENLRDKMVAEQFVECFSHKLVIFIKERKLDSLDQFGDAADKFLEA